MRLISSINWVQNFAEDFDILPEHLKIYINKYRKLVAWKTMSLIDLHKLLQEKYWKWEKLITAYWRISDCMWWVNTRLYRNTNWIYINNWQTNIEKQVNVWNNIVDPIWKMSMTIWMTWWESLENPEWYWFLWKVEELRPMSKKFLKEIYLELMNTKVKISDILPEIAIEFSLDEIAIMPIIRLEWWEEIIKNYSKEWNTNEIPTAKFTILNSNNY